MRSWTWLALRICAAALALHAPAASTISQKRVLGHAGHDLVGSIAWNEQALDSAAAYCRVPMSSSVDLASQTRQDGIQYRVGVHQVSPGRVDPLTSKIYLPCLLAQILDRCEDTDSEHREQDMCGCRSLRTQQRASMADQSLRDLPCTSRQAPVEQPLPPHHPLSSSVIAC